MFEITTYPSASNLSRASAKRQLRIAQSDLSFDDTIDEELLSAQILMYRETNVMAKTAELTGFLQDWENFRLQMDPVTAVVITFFDENSVEQTLVEGTDYLQTTNWPVNITFLETPTLQDDKADPIKIIVTAGYTDEAATPPDVLQCFRFVLADLFENRQTNTKTGNDEVQPRTTDFMKTLISRRVGL